MMGMAGGQSAKGDMRNGTFVGGAPIHCLMSSQMSIRCSEQGSSDDADVGMPGDDSNTSVPPCDRGAGSSYRMHGQSSDATLPRTRTSGSKRQSTDDSSEPSSRGKRYKDKYRKKKAETERLADAAFEIVQCLREDLGMRTTRDEEERQCLIKFKEYGIVDHYHDFCVSYFDNNFRRRWFLDNDSVEIWKWIRRNIVHSVFNPIPMQPNHVPMQPNQVPNQGFNAPNAPEFSQTSYMSRGPTF